MLQRPYRGSRVSSFYPVKSLPPLSTLDSAFQLQEFISLLIRLDVHDVDAIVSVPGKAPPKDLEDVLDAPDVDSKKSDDPDRKSDLSVDRACWIYEQLRRLAQDLSHPLITMLQQECTRSSCPQMKAGEWLYLCVAHGNDGAMEQCCAIDYILHTVDSATALLNSPRAFPSRLSIPQTSHRHFSSLARRLGRIFAHAYFHHREAFEQAEAESSLYARFLKLTNQFDLVPPEFLVIPESAIHHDEKSLTDHVEPPRLFSAVAHPTPVLQNESIMADSLGDFDSRPRALDAVNHVGTDSPRRLGRSRTDTMVFSDGFSVTEDLSRSDEATQPADSSLLAISPTDPDLSPPDEDMEDEDVTDTRSDLTIPTPLSPPVEALSLISLEDNSGVTTSSDTGADDAPSYSLPQDDIPAFESVPEPPDQIEIPSEEPALVDEPPISQVAEFPSEEALSVPLEPLTESTEILPAEEESVEVSNHEDDEHVPHNNQEPESTEESQATSELPPPPPPPPLEPEPTLELNEPPPSEPVAPESESDITDEAADGLSGNEVGTNEDREGEAVVSE